MDREIKHSIGSVEALFLPGPLPQSWLGKVGSSFFFRTSALDDYPKAETLFKHIEEAITPLRIAVLEVSSPVLQWEFSTKVHASLVKLGWEKGLSAQNAVIHLPLDPFYVPQNEEKPSEFLLKDFQRLTRLQNTDGWIFYAFWVAEMAERVLEKFPLEEHAAYTLEGHLKNFLHEVRAAMLMSNEWETLENTLRAAHIKGHVSFPVPDGTLLVDLEKRLIKGRSDARERLVTQMSHLADIAQTIFQLESPQNLLLHLGRASLFLSALLKKQLLLDDRSMSPFQEVGLLTLLNRELGCVGVIVSENGIDRVNPVFAIEVAWSALAEKFPFEEIVQAALQWDQIPYQQGGAVVEQLRQNVLAALEGLCLPMTRQGGQVHKMEWHFQMRCTHNFLKFLPTVGKIKNKAGESVNAQLLILDDKGEPADLTPAGHFLMTKLQFA